MTRAVKCTSPKSDLVIINWLLIILMRSKDLNWVVP